MKKKIVVDSSVIVKWLNSQDENNLEQADQLLKDCQNGKVDLLAPELAKYEVGNAILYKGMDIPKTKACINTLSQIPVNFIKLSFADLKKTIEIARESKITFYDATFVEISYKEKAVLVSANPKHQKSFEGVKVLDLKDY